ARYDAAISGLKYLTGVGRSPVSTSCASWYSARTVTRAASTLPPKRLLRMTASAWATSATWRLCSWMFSGCVLYIKPQRRMNFIRERYAKKWLMIPPRYHVESTIDSVTLRIPGAHAAHRAAVRPGARSPLRRARSCPQDTRGSSGAQRGFAPLAPYVERYAESPARGGVAPAASRRHRSRSAR